ncbi:MAG: hypothetical protein J6J17_00060 [Bacilli bacterium]|nr:hypothetical protein [Bacilli bacterium]
MDKKRLKRLKYAALSLALVTSLTGCGKKADCEIKEDHAHLYTNDEGYCRYIMDKEYLKYEGYERNDDYILITEDEKSLYKFFDKNNLLLIEDNIDTILQNQAENKDYIEYRYSYIYNQPIPNYMLIGKETYLYYTYITTTMYSWTRDANHANLTGEQRKCHYVYTAYKIEKDENGKFVLIPSEPVDDIRKVMEEYPYIKEKYYKIVDLENGYDLDYEEGPEEELEKIEDNLDSSKKETNKKYTLG